MERKLNTNPAFSQILILQDFTRSLFVPSAFGQKYEDIMPKNAKLRNQSGETWDVKVEKIDGCYYITDGWKKFAEEMRLEQSDFLTFSLTARSSTFDVAAYGKDGCGKALFGRRPNYYELIDEDSDDDEEAEYPENSNPKFRICLDSVQNVSRVYIPKHFANEAGLIMKKKVKLEYPPNGHRSKALLDFRLRNKALDLGGGYYRLDLAKGWSAFQVANGLQYGKT